MENQKQNRQEEQNYTIEVDSYNPYNTEIQVATISMILGTEGAMELGNEFQFSDY